MANPCRMLIFRLHNLHIKKSTSMSDSKDYSKLTLEELSATRKKMKNGEILSAVLVGFLIGVIIYGLVSSGPGFLYIFLSVALILLIVRNSKSQKEKLREIEAEIEARNKD